MKNQTYFAHSTYLSQLKRLRGLAQAALEQYPLHVKELRFIHYGENTTYRVRGSKKSYLLRLHRPGYHTPQAIQEELNWLESLSARTEIPVQRVVSSKSGRSLVRQSFPSTPTTYCSLLEWQPGRMRNAGLSESHFAKIGRLSASLHLSVREEKPKHRRYWTADGLLGEGAIFSEIKHLKEAIPKDFGAVERMRRDTYKTIAQYQKSHPKRMSLIHADLHLGNVLWHQGRVHPIDFDDCGWGCHLYDLAVTLGVISYISQEVGHKKARTYQQAFLQAYQETLPLGNDEREALPFYSLTRRLTMFAWLYGRRDNPRLWEYFKKTHKKTTRDILCFFDKKSNYDLFN